MNTFKIASLMVVVIMVLAIDITCSESLRVEAKHRARYWPGHSRGARSWRRGWTWNLTGIVAMTCNKSPKICHLKGSSSRDCCGKKCVDVRIDKSNCGRCGKRCQYSEICCRGYCVHPMFDKRHCGGCFKKCNKGRSCAYGMCSYA